MDLLAGIAQGFSVAMAPMTLLHCVAGVIIGTAIGVLPGLGPTATISLLLPITYRLDPVASVIMLSGIYYGAMYGSSITAILVRIPGEAASIVTCIDGYEMARRGRAGRRSASRPSGPSSPASSPPSASSCSARCCRAWRSASARRSTPPWSCWG